MRRPTLGLVHSQAAQRYVPRKQKDLRLGAFFSILFSCCYTIENTWFFRVDSDSGILFLFAYLWKQLYEI